jgi:thiol-disulfide isomerase/thioredoxin
VVGNGPAGFGLALGLSLAFAAGIGAALRRKERAPCRCFGVSTAPLGRTHLARNAVVGAAAVAGLALTSLVPPGAVHPAGVVLTVLVGAVLAALVVRMDDLVALFAPLPTLEEWEMGYLAVSVAVVAAITILNLLLTLGVARRLREHAARLAELPADGLGPPPDLMLAAGTRPAEFHAETVDGGEVSLASLATPALLGFFSPDCPPCREWIPRFVRAARELPQGRAQALAVVTGNATGGDEVAQLRPVAQVVLESSDGPVSRAFEVKGWPALCRLGADGTIITNDGDAALAAPAPV